MTFDDMWKSLEEKDTTGKYKQAREIAELGTEQLEYAYNSGYTDAKSKYERPQGEWIRTALYGQTCLECNQCGKADFDIKYDNFCPNCGADMRKGGDK